MLWGGRFKEKLDKKALDFSSSIGFDINLILEDIEGSIAHAEMLFSINIISKDESEKIINGLNQIKHEWLNNNWNHDFDKFEDIHSAVESRLSDLIGEASGKLHTGRSRNDQVATDIKLWMKKSADELIASIKKLQKTLLIICEGNVETIIPGYTHLQRAQPISLAFHLLAYIEMLERDKKRVENLLELIDQSPLGSSALAGSTLPLDRNFTASKLGFKEPTRNALDSVSDRDHLIDYLNICSIGMMHLSRLCEEIILWSSAEWNFIKLSDRFTTGSSLMPQKKNPDIAELIRGKSGRVFGNYISLITTLKGLPLSYNRDLQEDKEPIFDSHFTFNASLMLLAEMLSQVEFNKERFIKELIGDFSLATDLADWLVLKGIPFRKAHEIVGNVVAFLEAERKNFSEISLKDLKKINNIFNETALECLRVETALQRKATFGSPNPKLVKEQIGFWKKQL